MFNDAAACARHAKTRARGARAFARSAASGRASALRAPTAADGRERWLIGRRARCGGHRLRRRRFLRGRLLLGDLLLRALLRHYGLFLLAGRSGLLLGFLGLRLRLLRFLRHDRLPIVAAQVFGFDNATVTSPPRWSRPPRRPSPSR